MASRKSSRPKQSRWPLGSPHRKRWCRRPLLEDLENRLVLSGGNPSMPPDLAGRAPAVAASSIAPNADVVPVLLANGDTAWLQAPAAAGLRLPAGSGSSGGTEGPSLPSPRAVPGTILGALPVSSPFESAGPQQLPGPAGYVPQQIQTAYGLSTGGAYNNEISFGAIKGDGAGQTVGIYEEGYNSAFVDTSSPSYGSSALAVFDKTFGLTDPPSLTFVDHNGTPMSATNNSGNNPDFDNYGAGVEIALDIEWAHAMAPAASIVVLCATPDFSNFFEDVPLGIATLAGMPGISVISVSYGWFLDDFGQESLEQSWDTNIIQPALAANPDVSVFAASGDDAAFFGLIYPAASPEVVSVGGTSLSLTQAGQWSNETGWAGSDGGYSQAFVLPSYQQGDGFSGNVNDQRTAPDVAADADPNTGVAVYDPFDLGTVTPWVKVGGSSLSTPLWAGMATIADQGRVLAGGSPLGSTAMLTDLYDLDKVAPGDFHDITQGNNGYPAGPGYDLVTGLGSPRANLVIPALSAFDLASATSIITQPPPVVVSGGSFGIIAAATDSLGITDVGFDGTATLSLAGGPVGASFMPVTVPVVGGQAVFSNLSLSKKGSGYTFRVTMTGLSAATTNSVAVTIAQPGTGYYYPLPLFNELATDIAAADSNGDASNVITLSVSSLPYAVTDGQLVVYNDAKLHSKGFTIEGQGESSSVIDAEGTSRDFEILGNNISVVLQGLAITGGRASDGGVLGGGAALGGGLLIDGGTVAVSNVAVKDDSASGAVGAARRRRPVGDIGIPHGRAGRRRRGRRRRAGRWDLPDGGQPHPGRRPDPGRCGPGRRRRRRRPRRLRLHHHLGRVVNRPGPFRQPRARRRRRSGWERRGRRPVRRGRPPQPARRRRRARGQPGPGGRGWRRRAGRPGRAVRPLSRGQRRSRRAGR